MPANYWYVFDISRQSFTFWSALGPLALTCVGVGGVVLGETKVTRIGMAICTIVSAWFGVSSQWDNWQNYRHLQAAYRGHRYAVAEGPVENFRPDSAAGNIAETFDVDGRHFEVRRGIDVATFDATVRAGGPLLERACVRILYTEANAILWLGAYSRPCGSQTAPSP